MIKLIPNLKNVQLKQKILFSFFFSLLVIDLYSQPIINSFSPKSGPVGTLLTIRGHNFNANRDNIIFFGSVRAALLDASDSALLVSVPIGASYEPISVTTNFLTGYSTERFVVTFPGARPAFSSANFAELINIPANSFGYSCTLSDIDGDGKPDMVTNNGGGNNFISLYSNLSNPSKIKFAQRLDIPNYRTGAIAVKDINGDGKPDIIASDNNYYRLSVFTNASQIGQINFLDGFTLASIQASDIAIGDLDGDGKPEVIATDGLNWKISIFPNKSTGGSTSFDTRIDFPGGTQPKTIVLEDLDGDGKKDIIINYSLNYKISVYKNISTGVGNINFAAPKDFATPYGPSGIAIGDLDMDGKPDVVTTDTYANRLTVFKNISITDTISFAPKVDYVTAGIPRSIVITDLDGDGKPDIAVGNIDPSTLSVFKNTSTSNNLSLAAKVDFDNFAKPYALAIADIDGDGKPDIATANDEYYRNTVLRNRQGESIWKTFCPPAATTAFKANKTGLKYQWQLDMGSGFADISENIFYSGSKTANLQVKSAPSEWYGYRYKCLVDSSDLDVDVLELRFSSTWLGTADNNWGNPENWDCLSIPDSNTDVIMNKGRDCYISGDINIRSLIINPRQGVQVSPNVKIVITH